MWQLVADGRVGGEVLLRLIETGDDFLPKQLVREDDSGSACGDADQRRDNWPGKPELWRRLGRGLRFLFLFLVGHDACPLDFSSGDQASEDIRHFGNYRPG